MRFKAVSLFYFSGQFFGQLRGFLYLALKYRIAALDIRSAISRTDVFQKRHEFFHRQGVFPANIDTSKKGNVCLHVVIV
jgi:hypothetical protein